MHGGFSVAEAVNDLSYIFLCYLSIIDKSKNYFCRLFLFISCVKLLDYTNSLSFRPACGNFIMDLFFVESIHFFMVILFFYLW